MNENNKQAPGFIGTGEGESPLANPMPQNINIRTMGSDVQSIGSNDGSQPKGYEPKAASGIFTPPQVPQSGAPTNTPNPTTSGQGPEIILPPKKSGKGLLIALIMILVIGAGGAAGYFFLYPNLASYFGQTEEITEPTEEATQPTQTPEEQKAPEVIIPQASTTPILTATSSLETHIPLLKTPANATEQKTVTTLTPASLKTGIQFTTTQVAVSKELIYKNAEGKIIATPVVLQTLFPDVFTDEAIAPFEPDGTIMLYADKTGTWVNIAAKIKDPALTLATVQATLKKLETSNSLKNIFIQDAGYPSTWKDGKNGGRYTLFSKSPASIDYIILGGNTVLISTSYEAKLDMMSRLGF
jgi:hypothetical protein